MGYSNERASINNHIAEIVNENKQPNLLNDFMLTNQRKQGLLVQSVYLPPNFVFKELKREELRIETAGWLKNKIQSVYTAFFEHKIKNKEHAHLKFERKTL